MTTTPASVRGAIAWAVKLNRPRLALRMWRAVAENETPELRHTIGRLLARIDACDATRLLRTASTGGMVSALAVDAAIHFDAGGAVVELLALRWFFLPCGHPVTDLEGALCGWGCAP